jgi:methylmalonyl-CoA mutase cobalamin-binding domain/chain
MSEQLIEAMVNMNEQEALDITKALMQAGTNPIDILKSCTRAMETVGKQFEEGHYFLPELIMAGEMLKQISGILKPHMTAQTGGAAEKKGRVLIGTVEGDIHDIGKDIVTFLLDVNGFEVRDIGINVPPDKFVEEIKSFKPRVVGMSGLLTLAFDAMRDTVAAIEKAGLRDSVKIMIGGGITSEKVKEFAGADAYGKDAMAAVTLTEQWITK